MSIQRGRTTLKYLMKFMFLEAVAFGLFVLGARTYLIIYITATIAFLFDSISCLITLL